MKNKLTVIAAVLIVLAVVTACPALAKETYKIGVAAPLTGGLAFLGEGIMNGIKMAQESVGDTKYKYEVIFEDNQHDPKVSVTLANKFFDVDKADAIITIGDESGPVVSPIATAKDKIHMAIAVQRYIAKGYNNFMHWTPADEQTTLLISEMKKRGVKKVAAFRSRYVGFVELFESFKKNLKGSGIELVSDQVHDATAVDFRSQIAMAKKKNPDIYLLLTLPPALEIVAKQLKEAGETKPLTSCEAFGISPEASLFEGEWFIAPAGAQGYYRDAYKARYGSEPPMATGNAIDIFELIVRAVESTNTKSKPSAKQVSDELHKIKYHHGALGIMHIDKDGVVVTKPQPQLIKDARPTPLYDENGLMISSK
ncbi:MAG: ABC transporter substrate-binding protein [Nitrospirota bacterium]